jgi:hypothetical protein
MTVDELLKLTEDDGTDTDGAVEAMWEVLPKILLGASSYFASYDGVPEFALKLAAHVIDNDCDEDNARVTLEYLARIAHCLLVDYGEGLTDATHQRLETIMDTLPELAAT